MRLFLLCLILTLVSCHSPLEKALSAAGENRSQLEKVLYHYKQDEKDSLKLKAAIFLIENMPGHQSLGGSYIDKYYKETDSILSNDFDANWQKHLEDVSFKYSSLLVPVKDIQTVNAKYLIANIDSAFHVWQDKPWAKHIDFADFCEYILPYKVVEYQPIENWRELFYGKFEESMNDVMKFCATNGNSSYWACTHINQNLRNQHFGFTVLNLAVPLLHPSLLVKLPAGTCFEHCLTAINVMRSKGIPVALDFTPQWPYQSQGHSWCVVLTDNGQNVIFAGVESDPGHPHIADKKMAKVFRYTYAHNCDLQELNKKERYVPFVFQDCFIKDVTSEYTQTCDVEIEIPSELKQDNQYVYLAIFDNQQWAPINWAKIKNGKALFKDMGRDIIYMPIYCTSKGIQTMSYPFLLDQMGKVHDLKADTLTKQKIRLNRKYPTTERILFGAERLIGGKIQVANHADFKDSLTLYQISDLCSSGKFTNIPDSAWRYWRYLSPGNSYGNISELAFFKKDSIKPTKGRIIGTGGSFDDDPSKLKEVVFDGDPLTSLDTPVRDGAWVGMDFGEKVKFEKIIYIPRTDGNMIQLGDTYELYWWSINGWKRLGGKKVAEDIVLEYANAPTNALFGLRNISRGKEESVFIYQNGEQVFR